MDILIYFVTVFPIGLTLFGLIVWYDNKNVGTGKSDSND